MNLEMLPPLKIMQTCCKIMEYIVKVFPKTLISWSPTYESIITICQYNCKSLMNPFIYDS
jgi:hypothetical protein